MELKNKYEDYTEAEFLEFLTEFFDSKTNLDGEEFGKYLDKLCKHFEKVTEHPQRKDLIYFPAEGVEDGPQGVLKAVKEWRAANGKPGFKTA